MAPTIHNHGCVKAPDPTTGLDVATMLSLLGDAVDGAVLAALRGTGLRRGHGYLVQRLLVGPATATQLADELGVSQQAASKAVRELTALGHVEVVPDPPDRRSRPVRLTRRGLDAVETARAARRGVDRRIRAALDEADVEDLRRTLQDVLAVLGLAESVRRRSVRPPSSELG